MGEQRSAAGLLSLPLRVGNATLRFESCTGILGPGSPAMMFPGLLHALLLLLLLLLLVVLDEVAGLAKDDDGAEDSKGEEADVGQEGHGNGA